VSHSPDPVGPPPRWLPALPPVESLDVSSSRPSPLFAVLMGASLLSAFALPARFAAAVRAPVQGLFWPVARPTRYIAGAIYGRFHTEQATDDGSPRQPRAADVVYAENHALKTELAALQVKFDQLSRLNADRKLVGNIRDLCEPATVTGSDSSGVREALAISGVGSEGAGKPVVHGTDLVGRVQSAGVTGASVRLLTDPGFGFTAQIDRYTTDAAGQVKLSRVAELRPLVQGVGHGAMAIRSTVTMARAAELHLAAGDVVVLDDDTWPANVQGFTAGRVVSVTPQAAAPMFADIRVEPAVDLMRLNEVMVVVRE
jgi:cell shape-determining protein MreC